MTTFAPSWTSGAIMRPDSSTVRGGHAFASTSWNSTVTCGFTVVIDTCGGWTPKSVIAKDVEPAAWTWLPFSWTCTLSCSGLVTPWTVSWPGMVSVCAWPLSRLTGTATDWATNVASGYCDTESDWDTIRSRWLTLKPATWSTLWRSATRTVNWRPVAVNPVAE